MVANRVGGSLMGGYMTPEAADRHYRETHDETDAPEEGCALCGGPVGDSRGKSLEGERICRECEINMPEPDDARS